MGSSTHLSELFRGSGLAFSFFDVLKGVGLLVAYAVAINAGWWLSKELEVVPGTVSWFLPAGVRLCAIFLVPRRYWLFLWTGEIVANGAFTELDFDFQSIWSALVSHGAPFLCYAVPVLLVSRHQRDELLIRSLSATDMAIAASWSAANLGFVWTLNLAFNEVISLSEVPAFAFNVALGDLVGICLLLPIAIASVHLYGRRAEAIPSWAALMAFAGALLVALVLPEVIDFGPGQYYWRVGLLLLVGIAAHRAATIGACIASWAVSVLIVGSHLNDVPLGSIQEDEFFIVFLTLSALILGGAIQKQRILITQLRKLGEEREQLAIRLVDAGERERRNISRELHDNLGQLLSGVGLKLQVLRLKPQVTPEQLDDLGDLIDITYTNARNIMYQLSPSSLLDMGLESALRSPQLTAALDDAGIEYRLHIDLDARDHEPGIPRRELPQASAKPVTLDALKLHLCRIVQEAAHNAEKHAKATSFDVWLTAAHLEDQQYLQLDMQDDGLGFDTTVSRPGMGLINIRDRVAILGGVYKMSSRQQSNESNRAGDAREPTGTHYLIVLPLPKDISFTDLA